MCVFCLYPIPDFQQCVKRGSCRRLILSGLPCLFLFLFNVILHIFKILCISNFVVIICFCNLIIVRVYLSYFCFILSYYLLVGSRPTNGCSPCETHNQATSALLVPLRQAQISLTQGPAETVFSQPCAETPDAPRTERG